jgi:hypothetical protein
MSTLVCETELKTGRGVANLSLSIDSTLTRVLETGSQSSPSESSITTGESAVPMPETEVRVKDEVTATDELVLACVVTLVVKNEWRVAELVAVLEVLLFFEGGPI